MDVIDWARNIPVHDLSDGRGLCRVIFAEDFLNALKDLPSAQPERKKGTVSYTHFSEELWGQSAICDLCGCKWQISENGDYNYCPNCGADMRGEDA